MVMWSTWLSYAASAMGLTTVEAGVIVSMAFTMGCIIAVLIATKGRQAGWSVPIVGLVNFITFTYMNWLPTFLGSVMALCMAVFLGWKIASSVGE